MGHDTKARPPARCARLARLCVPIRAAILCGGLVGQARAQVTEKVLLNFDGTNGEAPIAPLLADTAGPSGALRALYATAQSGYSNLFKLSPPKHGKATWKDSELWTFSGTGDNPVLPGSGGLFAFSKKIGPGTTLYGTTEVGGAATPPCLPGDGYQGCGAVYGVTGNSLTTIWSFTGGSDGAEPYYGVIADKSGALYTTSDGRGGPSDCGTAIKLTPPAQAQTAWTETTLWTFTNGNDGCYPSGLIIDASGALYGTAYGGSTNNGTAFKLTPPEAGQTAWTEQTIWTFQGGTDASDPIANLTLGKGGALYGTTIAGGTAGNGTVFELEPPAKSRGAWKEKILWSFTGGNDGAAPYGSVIVDKDGALYGTASEGGEAGGLCAELGATGCGTAFRLVPPGAGRAAWSEITLWTFSGGNDGALPQAALTADKAGVLYGTGEYGGSVNAGVVFSLTGTGFVP